MSTLGELLVLFHDASERAPARDADRRRLAPRVAERGGVPALHGGALRHARARVRAAGRGAGNEESSWSTRLAFEGPTRFREEAAGVQAGTRFLVRDGERWASWDEDWGAVTSESAEDEGARSSSYGFLLDPTRCPPSSASRPAARPRSRGAPRWRVTAARRDDGSGLAALFRVGGAGADAIELAVDAERGALLRVEATIDGAALPPARGDRDRLRPARRPRRSTSRSRTASRRPRGGSGRSGSSCTSSRPRRRSPSSCPAACRTAGGCTRACSSRARAPAGGGVGQPRLRLAATAA